MPNMGMYTVEGTLAKWLRPSGENVTLGEPVAEIEAEKATFEVEAPAPGILHQTAKVGSKVVIEGIIGYILVPGEAPPPGPGEPVPTATITKTPPKPKPTALEVRASPIARRLAAEHSIVLASITGSGPGGRIVEADVLAAVKQRDIAP